MPPRTRTTGFGLFPITVTITDVNVPAGVTGSTAVASSTATVADATLTATGVPVAASEGVLFTGTVATFTDPITTAVASEFSAVIDWGDGSPNSVGTVTVDPAGGFDVTGSHVYKFGASFPTYPITVKITDASNSTVSGSTVTATTTATVTPAALTPGSVSITETEGIPFKSVEVGSFTSANPLAIPADFKATVDWGDGTPTSVGTIVEPSNGIFYVYASHTYAEETPAGTPDAITVTVTSTSAATTTIDSTATVLDAPLTSTGLPVTSVSEASPPAVLTVATFTDANPTAPVSDYTVVINWGDGTTSTGSAVTITPDGTSFQGSVFTVWRPLVRRPG